MDLLIRQANKSDIKPIMRFIDEHWKKDHILSCNLDFFNYEFVIDEKVNFIISIDHNKINGILGFINYGGEIADVFTVMWKTLKTSPLLVGKKLYDFLISQNFNSISSVGVNDSVLHYYKYMGFNVGTMNHWYRLNTNLNYSIALIIVREIPIYLTSIDYNVYKIENPNILVEIIQLINLKYTTNTTHKDVNYFLKRYFYHPIYQYNCYFVKSNFTNQNLVIVIRVETYNGHNVIRIIDMLGDYDLLAHLGCWIDELLQHFNAEYIDLYEFGIGSHILTDCGFKNVSDTKNIIPNYFSPFVQKNIKLNFVTTKQKAVFFKGDGDQDRPNQVMENKN